MLLCKDANGQKPIHASAPRRKAVRDSEVVIVAVTDEDERVDEVAAELHTRVGEGLYAGERADAADAERFAGDCLLSGGGFICHTGAI